MAHHRITSPSAPVYDATRLGELGARVPEALDLVSNVLECAVEAIDRQDVALARMVVGDDDYIDARYIELNVGIVSLLGRRSLDGVALRATMALLGVNRHVERIADLCVNLAKLVLLDGSDPPTDAVMLDKLGRMGSLAQRQLCQAKVAFAERDVALAEQLVSQDDELNRLNRDCFQSARDRRGRQQPRVGDAHDARRALAGAHRR